MRWSSGGAGVWLPSFRKSITWRRTQGRPLVEHEALADVRSHVEKTYGKRGETVLTRNYAAVDGALDALHEVKVPEKATSTHRRLPPVPDDAPKFVKEVLGTIIANQGDTLPVSAFDADGTFLEHLLFCHDYAARHSEDHSPNVALLHSILGTATNTFAMPGFTRPSKPR